MSVSKWKVSLSTWDCCELTTSGLKYTKLNPSFSCYLLKPPSYTLMEGKYIKKFLC